MNLFTAPETLPFGVAVALIVAVALLEGLGMLVALSPSNVIDDLLPHAVPESGLDRVLGWLHLGRVPALVLLFGFSQLKAQGTTILLVEQNVERALSVSDRAYILDQGRIVHEGPAAALLADEEIQSRYCAV